MICHWNSWLAVPSNCSSYLSKPTFGDPGKKGCDMWKLDTFWTFQTHQKMFVPHMLQPPCIFHRSKAFFLILRNALRFGTIGAPGQDTPWPLALHSVGWFYVWFRGVVLCLISCCDLGRFAFLHPKKALAAIIPAFCWDLELYGWNYRAVLHYGLIRWLGLPHSSRLGMSLYRRLPCQQRQAFIQTPHRWFQWLASHYPQWDPMIFKSFQHLCWINVCPRQVLFPWICGILVPKRKRFYFYPGSCLG